VRNSPISQQEEAVAERFGQLAHGVGDSAGEGDNARDDRVMKILEHVSGRSPSDAGPSAVGISIPRGARNALSCAQ
jgi:hypothetical protein